MKYKNLSLICLVLLVTQSLYLVSAYPNLEYPEIEILEKISDTGLISAYSFQRHQVYSNRTGLFYYFYCDGSGLSWNATDINGDIITSGDVFLDQAEEYGIIYDFSCDIHYQGDKIYLVVGREIGNSGLDNYKDEVYVYYFVVNEETQGIDLVSTDEVPTYGGRHVRYLDITVMRNGYQTITMSEKISTGNYGTRLSYSNSDTNYNHTGYIGIETVWNELYATNAVNTWQGVGLTHYGDNGFAWWWIAWDTSNARIDEGGLLVCKNFTNILTYGYNKDYFTKVNRLVNTYTPDNSIYFDVAGDYNGNLMGVYEKDEASTSSLYAVFYDGVTTTSNILITRNTMDDGG